MSRELLEYVGYDPDEVFEMTPEIACGAAVLDAIRLAAAIPNDENEVQSIIKTANEDLLRAGLEPTVDVDLFHLVAENLKATEIH